MITTVQAFLKKHFIAAEAAQPDSGQALQAALVPRLLRSLGNEAIFSGRTFREVRFERPADGGSGVLNFELRSRREDANAG